MNDRSIGLIREEVDILKSDGAGVPYPDGLEHAIIFYSTGHAARLEFGTKYRTYAELAGIWNRRFGIFLPALETHWKPFLDGARTLDSALDATLTALR